MFRTTTNSEREFRSPERKLMEKRDRLRIYIRKATKDSLTSSKRRMIIEYMDSLQSEIMAELFRVDEIPLTPGIVQQWLRELQGKDDDFYREMEQRKIIGKLVCCLQKCEDTATKLALANFINSLVYYQGHCVEYFEDANTLDFYYAEIQRHNFERELDREYICAIVVLMRSLTAEMKNDFNWYLIDYNFCDKLSSRMINEEIVEPEITRQLLMLRTNLILTEGKVEHGFEERVLSTLNEKRLGEHNHPPEYLDLLNAYLKKKMNNVKYDFPTRYPSIVETAGEYFRKELPTYQNLGQCGSKAFYVKLLKLVKLLTEPANDDILMCLETIEESPTKELFIWALCSPEGLINSYALSALARYFEHYLKRFQPSEMEVSWLVETLFTRFWQGKCIDNSLEIISGLLTSMQRSEKYTARLLQEGLLERLNQYITTESTITADTTLAILQILELLMKFEQTITTGGNQVVRLMNSNQLAKWTLLNVLNPKDEISQLANKLAEQYLTNSGDSDQLESEH